MLGPRSVTPRLYCRIKRYKNQDFMSNLIMWIQYASYLVFVLGAIMYLLAITPNENIKTTTNATIWVFCIIFLLFMVFGSKAQG